MVSGNNAAFDEDKRMAYVTDYDSNAISVVDLRLKKTLYSIPVGKRPNAITINPDTNKIYVSNYGSDSVTVIDALHNKILSTIAIGNAPNDISVNRKLNIIYVSNEKSGSVSVIDGSFDKLMVGVTFNVNPPSAGHIQCNDEKNNVTPISQQTTLREFPTKHCVSLNPTKALSLVTGLKNRVKTQP